MVGRLRRRRRREGICRIVWVLVITREDGDGKELIIALHCGGFSLGFSVCFRFFHHQGLLSRLCVSDTRDSDRLALCLAYSGFPFLSFLPFPSSLSLPSLSFLSVCSLWVALSICCVRCVLLYIMIIFYLLLCYRVYIVLVLRRRGN